jgi:parvulin-like peptidyl-prolyl isomerase
LQPRGPDAVAKEQPTKVVATINGKQITAQQAADLMSSLSAQDRKKFENNLPGLLQQLYMEDQIAAAAAKENLDQKPPYKQQLQMARANILTQAYLANLANNPAAADQAKQYYDGHTGDFDQVKLSGIVVAFNPPGTPATNSVTQRTEAEAQAKATDLEKKIKAGGDFSALARTDSDQQQSATKGGEMGSFLMADNIPPEIKSAIAKLQSGQVAEPVRVNGGYIIFKLDTRTHLPFDQVKSGLIQKLELDKYKIHVDDPEFFTATSQTSNVPSLARPNPPATQTTPGKPPAK